LKKSEDNMLIITLVTF